MAPPNGRTVLIFRARCECPKGRMEVWGAPDQEVGWSTHRRLLIPWREDINELLLLLLLLHLKVLTVSTYIIVLQCSALVVSIMCVRRGIIEGRYMCHGL
uniref:Uncharacterized protein n=1 Tax=Arundo donax TaxID=35708 RepID=A0A0A9FCY5_ARUDO